jgi:translation initiation factor 2B subunit (eIF-2B alpha/beta/delta family)
MQLKRNIVSLFNNKTDGSTTLLIKLNTIVKKELVDREYVGYLIKESRKRFNSFSAIINYLNEIEPKLNNINALNKVIDYYQDYEEVVNRRIFENGKRYFLKKSRILTISNSLTIASFLTSLHEMNKKLEVIIAESRPKNEGRNLAKILLKKGIPIEFITDFSATVYAAKSDAVITGADKILSNGNAVNKTGSRALAILCRYYNKPFYVIASKNKYSSDSNYKMEEKSPAEVWKFSDKKLKIRNSYFEEIERDLITRIITD